MATNPEDTHPLAGVRRDVAQTLVTPAAPLSRPAAPEAYLVHVHPPGPTLGRRALIGRDPVVIGRLAECAVHDPDPSVSRTHARIELRPDGRFQVTDLGSTNGTFVNHARVAVAALGDGDYVRVGGTIYRFLCGGNIEAGYHEEIHRLAVVDPLTGLPNRRALEEFLAREVYRSRRYRRPLSVLLLDLDHFRALNERLGRIAGDLALRAAAAAVGALVRGDELLARYGGEEFALVLPETEAAPAAVCGERLRRAVEEYPFEWDGRRHTLTASVGVGTGVGGDALSAADLLGRAEGRVAEAKRGGRNRVCAG